MSTNRSKIMVGALCLVAVCDVAQAQAPITAADLQLIQRVTFGPTTQTLRSFAKEGRNKWLADQLHYAGDRCLPAPIRDRIDHLDIEHQNPIDVWQARQAALKSARESGSVEAVKAARQQYDRRSLSQAFERRTLRALYCTNQLQEKLVWFWYNHFNVYGHKGITPIFVPDYEEQAIRPHVLGKFQDLLMSTVVHPAMLEYLDNARNAKDKPNENYGREIMELHTMGVDSGYKQGDVQELARILSGVGFHVNDKPVRIAPHFAPYVVEQGAFLFNPARHDSGNKVFLGKPFNGSAGFEEIERAVAILAHEPATARHISEELAMYFLADKPPIAVVDKMAQTYMRTDGEIAAVLRTLFDAKRFNTNVRPKFKDPAQYIYSSIRLLYGERSIGNIALVRRWIDRLSEDPYNYLTPEGYGMRRSDWASVDQMTKRLNIVGQVAAGGDLDRADLEALEATYATPNLTLMLARTHGEKQRAALIVSSPRFMEY
ncbi:MAG: DUF1800 domain-containing protein [Burkholderiaceae bacterium]